VFNCGFRSSSWLVTPALYVYKDSGRLRSYNGSARHFLPATFSTWFKYLFNSSISFFRRVRKLAKREYLLRHVYPSVYPSVRQPAWNNTAPTGRIFMKFGVQVFFENICRENLSSNKTWQEKGKLYMKTNIQLRSYLAHFFLGWEWEKSYKDNQNTHFMFNNIFRKSRTLWDNVEKYGRSEQATKWRYGACALHAAHLRLQTHTQDM